jgi:hypothetical protein
MSIKARIPHIANGDEHLAVRIGMAVAYQWDALPKAAQDLIVRQATCVEMPPMIVGQHESIRAFIRQHKDAD